MIASELTAGSTKFPGLGGGLWLAGGGCAAGELPPAVSFPYGAYHASEIQYLFPPAQPQLNAWQQQLATAVQKHWMQFAKTGIRTVAASLTWPKYTSAAYHAQSLVPPTPTKESTFATDHNCAFWATVAAS